VHVYWDLFGVVFAMVRVYYSVRGYQTLYSIYINHVYYTDLDIKVVVCLRTVCRCWRTRSRHTADLHLQVYVTLYIQRQNVGGSTQSQVTQT
jgi:hypothetical protein